MKTKLISIVLTTLGVILIVIAIVLEGNANYTSNKFDIKEVDTNNMAVITPVMEDTTVIDTGEILPLNMEITPAAFIEPPRVEVFEGMTIEELGIKLDRNMGTSTISGKGLYLAQVSMDYGIDPYLGLAIILHETGCGGTRGCSSLVKNCNNVGGQKGGPACSGSYKGFSSIDAGIEGFVSNLYRNYYAYGLTVPETIGPKYAASNTWVSKIHYYMNKIRNN